MDIYVFVTLNCIKLLKGKMRGGTSHEKFSVGCMIRYLLKQPMHISGLTMGTVTYIQQD